MPAWELDRSDFIPFGRRRGYAVKLYEYSHRGRKGRFLTIEQYEAIRDDYSGEYINRRKSQITIPNAEVARRIARELMYFAEVLEQSQGVATDEERKVEEIASELLGETKMNEQMNEKGEADASPDERKDEQRTSFRPKVHNRPPSESAEGEEGRD